MSNPGDPGRSQQDRGHYGAGWSQPAPTAPAAQPGPPVAGPPFRGGPQGQPNPGGPYGTPNQGGPYAPPRPPRVPADPRKAFAPGASITNTAGALLAVVSLVVVEFVSGLFGLLGTSLVVHPFSSSGVGSSLVGGFVTGVFLRPFPFYAGAFLAFAFLTPIARRSPLPTVLFRAVLAGAAGTIALALVGVFTGSFAAVRSGGAARLVVDVFTTPLQNGVPFTLMLLGTSTVAWLWAGRPRGGRRAQDGPGHLGVVRPADAVPPATVQPPRPQQPQQPPVPPYGAQQQPIGQQPPANPWGGPAPR